MLGPPRRIFIESNFIVLRAAWQFLEIGFADISDGLAVCRTVGNIFGEVCLYVRLKRKIDELLRVRSIGRVLDDAPKLLEPHRTVPFDAEGRSGIDGTLNAAVPKTDRGRLTSFEQLDRFRAGRPPFGDVRFETRQDVESSVDVDWIDFVQSDTVRNQRELKRHQPGVRAFQAPRSGEFCRIPEVRPALGAAVWKFSLRIAQHRRI